MLLGTEGSTGKEVVGMLCGHAVWKCLVRGLKRAEGRWLVGKQTGGECSLVSLVHRDGSWGGRLANGHGARKI